MITARVRIETFPGGRWRSVPAPAFTLVELLLSTAVTAVLMLVVVQMISDTQRVWSSASERVHSFRAARSAFEAMSRKLGQATLNAYWGYDNPEAPTFYQRQSELHFVSGPASVLVGAEVGACGHGVFFQAPLGLAEDSEVQKLEDTLNACGYWVSYGSDLELRPEWMRTDLAVNPERSRFRLMEYRPPTEQLDFHRLVASDPARPLVKKPWIEVQDDREELYTWFRTNLAAHSQPVADDILCVLVQPLAPGAGAPALAPDGHYDTRRHQWSADARAAVSRHQMPARLLLTIVALDGDTWEALDELQARAAATALRELINTKLFKGSTAAVTGEQWHALAETDLAVLQKELMARKLRCRVFTSTVPVRAARWMTSKEQRP